MRALWPAQSAGRPANARRRNCTKTAGGPIKPTVCRAAAWAIVPAYPNELTPPTDSSSLSIAERCVDSPSVTELSTPPTCGLSDRSCVLGAASPHPSATTSLISPVIPAAASACPTLAFTPPNASGLAGATPHETSTALTSEPASIGSPSAVPVPCASLSRSSPACTPASHHAAASSPCCACPLGAVRLALRPSCRTALPSKPNMPTTPPPSSTTAPHASPRA
eukprot:6831158-Prymnesium_polylepis.1